jgi:hypothetical protein
MDKDQIVYKLKSAIEDNKLQPFELECTENILQIDLYIKVTITSTNDYQYVAIY